MSPSELDRTTSFRRSPVKTGHWAPGAVLAAILIGTPSTAVLERQYRGSVELIPCPIPGVDGEMLCGSFEVFENGCGG